FFAENKKMKLVLNKDSLKNSKVTGSAANMDYQEYEQRIKLQNDRLNSLSAWSRTKGKLDKKTGDSVTQEWKIIGDERETIVRDFIKEHPNSIVSAYAITRHFLGIPDLASLEAQYNSLTEKVQQTTFGKQINEKIGKERLTAIGKYAPEFTQNDTLGNPVSLSSFKGQYVLLDFWASWCVPCRAENPNVVKAFNSYKDKNFTVLSVSLDRPEKKQAWLDAIHKDELTWTHVSDLEFWDNRVAKQYGISAIPQNLLLDPAGKIIAKNIRGEDLQEKLEELIK
ncbi:MAG TPA: TlpA disulfide reductase family protein, partial [Chitinophagaceae bacterium]|nr:TlpA disulfide reductase family protein [Chitinophagaceae bacterium]